MVVICVNTMSLPSKSAKQLKRQFDSSLKMVRQAIDVISDDYWHKGMKEWYYSQSLYHILETMEFYLASSPTDMVWGARAGFDPETALEQEILTLISKELVLNEVAGNPHYSELL